MLTMNDDFKFYPFDLDFINAVKFEQNVNLLVSDKCYLHIFTYFLLFPQI